jgi:hypothetical protein
MDTYHANPPYVNRDLFEKQTSNTIEAGYPESPGSKGPPDGTSAAAARAIAPSVGRLCQIILKEFREAGDSGLTADEAARRVEKSPLYVRPRISELKARGALVPVGIRRANESGLMAMVFKAVGSAQ